MANLNYPDDFRGFPVSLHGDMPGEVRVCLEEMAFDGGETLVTCSNLWAVVETETGDIMRFEADNRTQVQPDAIAAFAAERWLATAEGRKSVQYYITRELEG